MLVGPWRHLFKVNMFTKGISMLNIFSDEYRDNDIYLGFMSYKLRNFC